MNETDLRVFADAVRHYFSQLGDARAEIRTSFLQDSASIPVYDYTGIIRVGGDWRGQVRVSASSRLVSYLLQLSGGMSVNQDACLDAVGELANTLAGNARRHYGERLQVSVPEAYMGSGPADLSRRRLMVIMVDWKQYGLAVLVDMTPT